MMEKQTQFSESYILLGRGREVYLETGGRVRIKEILKIYDTNQNRANK